MHCGVGKGIKETTGLCDQLGIENVRKGRVEISRLF